MRVLSRVRLTLISVIIGLLATGELTWGRTRKDLEINRVSQVAAKKEWLIGLETLNTNELMIDHKRPPGGLFM
jgi:hypothetical protein